MTTLRIAPNPTVDPGPQTPREHERYLPEDEREWSRHSAASTADEPVCLFLRAEKEGLLSLEDCKVTSHEPKAQPIKDAFFGRVGLTVNEAQWLLRVLPHAINYSVNERKK